VRRAKRLHRISEREKRDLMNELSMVMRLAGTAETAAVNNGLERVDKVHALIGELSSAEAEYIVKYFMDVREQYPHLKTAELTTEKEMAAGRCNVCEIEFELTANNGKCPKCGGMNYKIIRGRSLSVGSIEGE